MIPYARQSLEAEDEAAVLEVLRSAWLTTGPQVEAFENALAERVGARHAVAVSSGTAALHCALALSQLRRLGGFIGRRRRIASRYDVALKDCCAVTPLAGDASGHGYHLCT